MNDEAPPAPGRAGVDSLHDAAWQRQAARPLLIALQATCLVGSLGLVVAVVSGDAPGFRFTSWLIFLAALAGVYSAQWLAGPAQRLVGKTGFQLAQLLLLLAVLRVLTWALAGDWPTLADLRGWILHPWTFFDGIFVALAILCALAWHRASVVGGIFYRLALTPGELAVDSERRMSSWRMGRHSERVLVSRADLVEDYVVQWMVGGVFLALFAAATRVRIGPQLSLNVLDMGVPAPMVAALAFYFLIGLALLSQARLAVLRAQWLVDGVEMPERLPSRWNRWSLLVIVAMGFVAALLPLGSSWQLGAIVNALLTALMQIALFFIFLVATFFALILSLLGQQPEMPEIPQQLTPIAPAAPMMPLVQTPPWLGGISFWLIAALALLIALRVLLGKEGLEVTRRKLRLLLASLRAWIGALAGGARGLARSIQVSLPGRRSPPADNRARQPWRFVRLGGLPPREQVRYFYLSALHRAAGQGIVRRPAQTPDEFVQDLQESWPETELDIEALTEAFVTARYDAADISQDEARQVKSIWDRIKRALRGGRKNKEFTDELH